MLPTSEARDLLELTRDIADKVLEPRVVECEKTGTFPDGVFPALGAAGLLSLPYPEDFGGGAQPYEVYLQVLEELAARWAAVAVAVSVHSLSCHPLFTFGTEEQQQRWLATMLSGETIGAYSLSEPHAGSDAPRYAAGRRKSMAATGSTARRRGSPMAAAPISTPCSRAPAKAPAAFRASWCRATPRA